MPERKRYRVRAWGSDEYPDLDYETDDPPKSFPNWSYPCVSVALQVPISASLLKEALDERTS